MSDPDHNEDATDTIPKMKAERIIDNEYLKIEPYLLNINLAKKKKCK